MTLLLGCLVLVSSLLGVTDALGNASSIGDGHGHLSGKNGGNASDPCAPKPMSGVKQCLTQYYAFYDYVPGHMLSADAFNNKLSDIIMEKGTREGIKYVCKIQDALNTCLANVEEAESCHNPASYKAMLGTNDKSSVGYLKNNVWFDYACAHEKTFADNYDCLQAVDEEHAKQMYLCDYVAYFQMKLGVGLCSIAKFFQSCLTEVWVNSCGRQVQLFLCESMQRTDLVQNPQCKGHQIDCSVSFSPLASSKKGRHPPRRPTPLSYALGYDLY